MRFTTLGLLVAMAAGSMAHAEMSMSEEMNAGITMLQTATKQVLQKYGLEADTMKLSLSQLTEIQGLLEQSNSDSDTKAGIMAALARK